MLKVAVGHSEQVDVEDILEEIFEQCEETLEGEAPQAGIVFAAVDLEYQEILSGIRNKWPDLQLVGCTTDGESSSRLGFVDDSVTLTLLCSDTIEITTGIGRGVSQDVEKATSEAVEQARNAATLEPGLCVITPASMTVSSEAIVNGVKQALGPDTPLYGANAGDQWQFVETFQFFNDEVLSDAVPLIMFSGPISISGAVQSGWKTIGSIGTVTKAEGNVVFEIDEQPALDFYRNLLGPDATPTGDRPLAILDANKEINRLRASIEAYDPETGSITFFGDFSVGDQVQVTVANRNEILDGTRASVRMARDSFPDGQAPEAVMFFSCSGRKLLLGTRTGEEYDILKEEIGADLPMFGFYGYGEIGPSITGESGCEFHNETFVTVLIGSQ
jgi:hypothetical protein